MSTERSFRVPDVFPTASRDSAKIKGAAFIEILKWYSATQNSTQLSQIARKLSPRQRQYVTRPEEPTLGLLPGTWYEAELVATVFREMTADLSPPAVRQLAEEAVRASVGTTLSGIYAGIIRMLVSPKMLADHYQKLWRLYHNTGEFKVQVLAPNKYEFRLSNWPVHDPFFCLMNFYATRLILELIGMKGVTGQQGGCVDRGDPHCSYIQSWKV
jgi:hypothetical protein